MFSKSRRQFIRFAGLLTGGLVLVQLPWSKKALADAKTPLVSMTDPTAKAVGYVEDHKKAPKAKGSKCSTCSFYPKKEDTRNGKEVGPCLIFPGKYVYGEGYCNSWAKKA